jgi:hypothetical protein
MKKIIVGAAVFVAAMAALRHFGPALGKWAMRKCEEVFDHMPEEAPPKRMMHGIEEIREQNTRILHRLDEEGTALAAALGGGDDDDVVRGWPNDAGLLGRSRGPGGLPRAGL